MRKSAILFMMALAFAAMPFILYPGTIAGDAALVTYYQGYDIYRGVSDVWGSEVYYVDGYWSDQYEFTSLVKAKEYIDQLNANPDAGTVNVEFRIIQGEGVVKILSAFASKPTVTLRAEDGSYDQTKQGELVAFLDAPSHAVDGVKYQWRVTSEGYNARSGSLLLKSRGLTIVVEVPLSKPQVADVNLDEKNTIETESTTVTEDAPISTDPPITVEDSTPIPGEEGLRVTPAFTYRIMFYVLSGFTFLMALIVRRREME